MIVIPFAMLSILACVCKNCKWCAKLLEEGVASAAARNVIRIDLEHLLADEENVELVLSLDEEMVEKFWSDLAEIGYSVPGLSRHFLEEDHHNSECSIPHS